MTTQREFITKIIECFPLHDDGTGHISDCGYTEDGPLCGCAHLPGRIADLLDAHDREVAARALRDAADKIDAGPTIPLPPRVFSALLREYAEEPR